VTVYYGDYPFYPNYLGSNVDSSETDKLDYWEHVARQAVDFFSSKEDFMEWVCSHYGSDENRFAADGSWDLVKYIKEDPEEDPEGGLVDCD
jgi:hypothetical protein